MPRFVIWSATNRAHHSLHLLRVVCLEHRRKQPLSGVLMLLLFEMDSQELVQIIVRLLVLLLDLHQL